MIPCKETKCLKQATCKSKRTIFCTLLYQYLYSNTDNYQDGFHSFPVLIDVYRDRELIRTTLFEGAPIINSVRLAEQMEENNP